MKKITLLVAVILAVAVVAVPAFAAVQNVKVSGNVDNTYLYRKNFDFADDSSDGLETQSVFFTQAILRVDAELTDQVAATIALINERVWNADPGTSHDDPEMDLYLAYVTLREMLYSPLTLVIGRQNFSYGNSFIIDSTGTNNTAPAESGITSIAKDLTKQTSLDAIRAILDYNPLTVDIVFAVIDSGTTTLADAEDSINLYGTNANYKLGDSMDSVLEAYFWKKVDKSVNSTAGNKSNEILTLGGRGSTNPIEGLNLQTELAYQKGSLNVASAENRRRDAWGFQFITNYQLPVLEEYNPTTQYVFTKVTGDSESGSSLIDDSHAWDPMFENQGGGTIYNTLFNLSNLEIHSLAFGVNPMEDVLAKLSVHSLWLNQNVGTSSLSFSQPDGSSESLPIESEEERHLGKELDFQLVYDYTEDVQIGGNLGWFFPGALFSTPDDNVAKQAIVNVNVAF